MDRRKNREPIYLLVFVSDVSMCLVGLEVRCSIHAELRARVDSKELIDSDLHSFRVTVPETVPEARHRPFAAQSGRLGKSSHSGETQRC